MSITSVSEGSTAIATGLFLVQYPPVTIAWQLSDLPNFKPPSAPLVTYRSASPTVILTLGPKTDDVVPAESPKATASHALSTEAKAGIGVGVVIGVLIVLALLGWALLKRRKRRNEIPSDRSMPHENSPEKRHSSEASAEQGNDTQVTQTYLASEMGTDNTRAELDAGWQGLEASPK